MNSTSQTTPVGQAAGQPASNERDNAEHERLRDYCCKLCKTITRYTTPAELAGLVETLDGFKAALTANRYAPGLNDAAYDLYAAFNLRSNTKQDATARKDA